MQTKSIFVSGVDPITHKRFELELQQDGKLIGDEFLIWRLDMAARFQTFCVGGSSPCWSGSEDILHNPYPLVQLAKQMFGNIQVTGELPKLDELPLGAIS